jgi:O-acetyl-ADP-ribose deacetylase (regulator of RNase III)
LPYYSGLRYSDEHLLEADDSLVVNPVNTIGVMGAGVARCFRDAFPDMFRVYQIHCLLGHLQIGRAFLWGCNEATILNVPTKAHWQEPSTIDYVRQALECIAFIADRFPTIGMPRLGCGLGGLKWEADVKPLVEQILVEGAGQGVTIYDGRIPPQQPWTVTGCIVTEMIDPIAAANWKAARTLE